MSWKGASGRRELECEGGVAGEKTEEGIPSMGIARETRFGMGRTQPRKGFTEPNNTKYQMFSIK